MKLSLSLSLIATIASSTGFLFAHAAPQLAGPDAIPVGDYNLLNEACKAGGPNSYVGVRYSDGSIVTFNFDQCYPYQLQSNGALAQQAVFCRSATCYNNPYPDCSGGTVPPAPVPVEAGLTLPNAGDWVQFLGQGAKCERNALSGVVV